MDEDDDDDCEIAEEEMEEGNGADGTVNEEHHQSGSMLLAPISYTSQVSSSHMTSSELDKDLFPVQLKHLRQSDAGVIDQADLIVQQKPTTSFIH